MADDDQLVAIIGMAGRFPGAPDLDAFWRNLVDGVESLVPLASQDEFDAGFFAVPDSEALLLDPQQRVFLECCWTAFEDAGYDPATYPGAVGVYAGSSETEYPGALRAHRDLLALAADWQIRMATGLDFLTGRVAYKLGLRGPAVTVQTACSTSLVATHLACQALIGGDCDLALSGGVTVHLWPSTEEPEHDGGLLSPDGHCRSFDADANGTVFGNGAGVLVLKRLSDARRDRDTVRAVILGSAVNNDGTDKIGFTAPSVTGQAAVIQDAQRVAGVDPATIGYLEAHGTGTPLGDPIEIAALTRAFRSATQRRSYCALGSVKANIGHVDAAAGVAGVIKTVLALEHGLLPPSVNFRSPNPEIDFASSPFYVTTEPLEWRRTGTPRRAGVSSLGIGGTNAHVVLEEASEAVRSVAERPYELLVVSARSEAAVRLAADQIAVRQHGHELADVAWTLQAGRRAHGHRSFAVCTGHEAPVFQAPTVAVPERPVAFAFPGQGGQRAGMCRALYEHEPEFRATIDMCAELAAPRLGLDLRTVLCLVDEPVGDRRLYEMGVGQPSVFALQYAVASLLRHWGVRPDVVVGHSLGAYAAACVAGVFTLPDALDLVIERGRLLESLPAGEMLAVPLPESDVVPLLAPELDLAVVNGPAQCVVAGPSEPIAELWARLAGRGADVRRLRIPVPAHSRYVAPIVAEFENRVKARSLRPPEIPVVSEMTGERVTAGEITSPGYWAAHLRRTVRFGDALTALFRESHRLIVEIGPGQALTSFARRHPGRPDGVIPVPALPHSEEETSELATVLTAVGQLWAAGVTIDWPRLHREGRRRVPLPTYPFERRRYTVGPPSGPEAPSMDPPRAERPIAGPPIAGPPIPEPPIPEPPIAEPPIAEPPIVESGVLEETEVEARVGALFRQLLGVPAVGRHDGFFALGGDSVLAAQLVRLARRAFAIPLPIRAVFQNPTVGELARYIGERLGPGGEGMPQP